MGRGGGSAAPLPSATPAPHEIAASPREEKSGEGRGGRAASGDKRGSRRAPVHGRAGGGISCALCLLRRRPHGVPTPCRQNRSAVGVCLFTLSFMAAVRIRRHANKAEDTDLRKKSFPAMCDTYMVFSNADSMHSPVGHQPDPELRISLDYDRNYSTRGGRNASGCTDLVEFNVVQR